MIPSSGYPPWPPDHPRTLPRTSTPTPPRGARSPSRTSADDHPGDRGRDGRGPHGAGPTGRDVPARSRLCRLAWADPGSALERGQGAARPDVQDGRALAPTLADYLRQRDGTLGGAQGRPSWLVAGAYARPQAPDAGAGGAGQQAG